jgi:hypothetical protein
VVEVIIGGRCYEGALDRERAAAGLPGRRLRDQPAVGPIGEHGEVLAGDDVESHGIPEADFGGVTGAAEQGGVGGDWLEVAEVGAAVDHNEWQGIWGGGGHCKLNAAGVGSSVSPPESLSAGESGTGGIAGFGGADAEVAGAGAGVEE